MLRRNLQRTKVDSEGKRVLAQAVNGLDRDITRDVGEVTFAEARRVARVNEFNRFDNRTKVKAVFPPVAGEE